MKKILARLIGPALGLSLCLLPVPALALINLPWSTTFNCPEWNQSLGLLASIVKCNGLAGGGAWTSSAGSKEQITSAANNPSGGGGRGQRSWIGDGVNNGSGGMSVSFLS